MVDNAEEEEELDEEEFGKSIASIYAVSLTSNIGNFLDDDHDESEAGWARPRSVTPSELYEEAADLRAQAAAAAKVDCAPRKDDIEVVPQHFLVPAQGDPEMWAIRVKVRKICHLSTGSN